MTVTQAMLDRAIRERREAIEERDRLRELLREMAGHVERLLIARHNHAHVGDIVDLGPVETCGICSNLLSRARAALEPKR